VDISTKASGRNPGSLLGTVNQSIAIMGEKLGQQELARANVVIRPLVNDIGPADFEQRNNAIMEGERATLAVMPQIRAQLAKLRAEREVAAMPRVPASEPCKPARFGGLFGKKCADAGKD